MDSDQPPLTYYQCPECLSHFTLREARGVPVCWLCTVRLRFVGEVEAIASDAPAFADVNVCDERCMFANGPKCECHCNAEQHGLGWVVALTGGKVMPVRRAEAEKVRDEWLSALEKTVNAVESVASIARNPRGDGETLRPRIAASRTVVELEAKLARAKAMKSQAGRLRALDEIRGACDIAKKSLTSARA